MAEGEVTESIPFFGFFPVVDLWQRVNSTKYGNQTGRMNSKAYLVMFTYNSSNSDKVKHEK
jgi:hypothetical protein